MIQMERRAELLQRIIEFVIRKAPKKKRANDSLMIPPPAPPPSCP